MSKENFTSDIKKDFSENIKNHAPELSEEHIKSTISKILGDVGDFLEEKKDKLGKTAKNKIKEHPIGCALAILAAGIIIGSVFKK